MDKIRSLIWLYLAYIYGVIGFLWIFFSDHLLTLWSLTDSQVQTYSIIKGLFFVLVTTYLLFLIGKKQRDHDQLKLEKGKLDMLINSMPDFVVFKDYDGRWQQANDFAVKLYGLNGVDYKGKRDSELANYTKFFKDTLMSCERTDELTWKSGKVSRNQVEVTLPDGGKKCFDTIKIPMFHHDHSRKGLLVMGRDISDLKETEEALLKTEKLVVVGELAAGIAHEIRNPLTTMKGFLQLVQEKNISIESCQELLIHEIERINAIVTELLMIAKPQLQPFTKESITEVLNKTIHLMSTEANLKNVNLSLDANRDFYISCSANQLEQVFINIIKNSIDSIPTKGEIHISLIEQNSQEFIIRFVDNGCGMDEERLKRIGEPFFSMKEKGIGLGMTVSYKIIKEHGGRVDIHSQLGEGTTVDVILPKAFPQSKDQ